MKKLIMIKIYTDEMIMAKIKVVKIIMGKNNQG